MLFLRVCACRARLRRGPALASNRALFLVRPDFVFAPPTEPRARDSKRNIKPLPRCVCLCVYMRALSAPTMVVSFRFTPLLVSFCGAVLCSFLVIVLSFCFPPSCFEAAIYVRYPFPSPLLLRQPFHRPPQAHTLHTTLHQYTTSSKERVGYVAAYFF